MLPLKLVCKSKNIRRDGTSLVYIQYCFNAEKRTLLNTQVAIPPSFWNKKRTSVSNNLPDSYRAPAELNGELKRMYRIAEDIISFAIKSRVEDVVNFVKKTFHPHFDVATLNNEKIVNAREISNQEESYQDFFFQFDNYIESKRKKVCKGMLEVYRHVKERLRAFETFRNRSITFHCIDYNFYDSLVEFLTFYYQHKRRKATLLGLKTNTTGQTIKQLRIFIKDRVRRKIIASFDLTDFKISEEEADAIYLSKEEIGRIYKIDLTTDSYLKSIGICLC
jgi:hypothetical protein